MSGLHSLVNHLAKIHGLVCQLSPTPVEDNLKYGAHQPSSTLKERHNFLLWSPMI